jgi:hypothetical protein
MRSPLTDPRPGDAIKSEGGAIRRVTDCDGVAVWYTLRAHGVECPFSCLIEEWRIEAKNAEIIRRGGE